MRKNIRKKKKININKNNKTPFLNHILNFLIYGSLVQFINLILCKTLPISIMTVLYKFLIDGDYISELSDQHINIVEQNLTPTANDLHSNKSNYVFYTCLGLGILFICLIVVKNNHDISSLGSSTSELVINLQTQVIETSKLLKEATSYRYNDEILKNLHLQNSALNNLHVAMAHVSRKLAAYLKELKNKNSVNFKKPS
jgi:hypothetical protein